MFADRHRDLRCSFMADGLPTHHSLNRPRSFSGGAVVGIRCSESPEPALSAVACADAANIEHARRTAGRSVVISIRFGDRIDIGANELAKLPFRQGATKG